jgi:hypothetical protein
MKLILKTIHKIFLKPDRNSKSCQVNFLISNKNKLMKRRIFLSTTAAAAGFTIVPRHVLGGIGYIAPSDKLNVACVGTGTQGTRVLLELLKIPDLQIVSVADPVKEDNRYQNWGGE